MFVAAHRLAPDNYEVCFDLGAVFFQLARYSEAEALLKRSLDKPNGVAYNNLSAVYFYQRRYEDAVAPMKKAIELEPANVEMWGSMGRTYRWAAYVPEAKAAYDKAVQLARQQLQTNPRDVEIRADLALFLAETANPVPAMREIEDALKLAPANVNVLFRAVLVYETLGDRGAALNKLAVIVHHGPLMEEIRRRPELDGLRSDPAYLTLVGSGVPEAGSQKSKGG